MNETKNSTRREQISESYSDRISVSRDSVRVSARGACVLSVSAVGGGGERVGAPGLSRGARGVGGVDSMRGVCAAQSVRAARGRPGDSRVLRPPRAQLIIS